MCEDEFTHIWIEGVSIDLTGDGKNHDCEGAVQAISPCNHFRARALDLLSGGEL